MAPVGGSAGIGAGWAKQGVHQAVPFGDTVGAGDTLMAAVLTLLDEQDNLAPGKLGAMDDAALATMLRFGAVAAGLNCQFVGCHPPTRAEVDAVLGS